MSFRLAPLLPGFFVTDPIDNSDAGVTKSTLALMTELNEDQAAEALLLIVSGRHIR